jgi:hypothetical protein
MGKTWCIYLNVYDVQHTLFRSYSVEAFGQKSKLTENRKFKMEMSIVTYFREIFLHQLRQKISGCIGRKQIVKVTKCP